MHEGIKYKPVGKHSRSSKFIQYAAVTIGLVVSSYFGYSYLAPESIDEWSSIRLPEFIQPIHYSLSFALVDKAYNGNVEIHLKVEKASQVIVVHNADMTVKFNSLFQCSSTACDVGDYRLENVQNNDKFEYTVYNFNQALEPGAYMLSLSYNATLGNSMAGFYSSSYIAADGSRKYLVIIF
jgi:aminopeptidase N